MHNGHLSDSNALIFEELYNEWKYAPETLEDRLEPLRIKIAPDGTFVEFVVPRWLKDLYKGVNDD